MCLNPSRLPNGKMIGCRKCKQCRMSTVMDWVGRCIAESKMSRASTVLTLTYGHDEHYGHKEADHVRAGVLTYRDVQLMLKTLRKDGHVLRYLCVGEYGSAKGRAHWHILIFWQSKPIDMPIRQNFTWEYWPHGFVFADRMDEPSIRYTMKYLQKQLEGEVKQQKMRVSLAPELGHFYFRKFAKQYVLQRLAPRDLLYTFPDSLAPDGRRWRYHMKRVTAAKFLTAYLEQWAETFPNEHTPWSELLDEFTASQEIDRIDFNLPAPPSGTAYPPVAPPGYDPVAYAKRQIVPPYSNLHKAYRAWFKGEWYYWTFDKWGNRAWLKTMTPKKSASDVRHDGKGITLGPSSG